MVGKVILSIIMFFIKMFVYSFSILIYLLRFSIPLVVLWLVFYYVIGIWNMGLWTVEARGFYAVLSLLTVFGILEQIKNEEEKNNGF